MLAVVVAAAAAVAEELVDGDALGFAVTVLEVQAAEKVPALAKTSTPVVRCRRDDREVNVTIVDLTPPGQSQRLSLTGDLTRLVDVFCPHADDDDVASKTRRPQLVQV